MPRKTTKHIEIWFNNLEKLRSFMKQRFGVDPKENLHEFAETRCDEVFTDDEPSRELVRQLCLDRSIGFVQKDDFKAAKVRDFLDLVMNFTLADRMNLLYHEIACDFDPSLKGVNPASIGSKTLKSLYPTPAAEGILDMDVIDALEKSFRKGKQPSKDMTLTAQKGIAEVIK